MDFFFWLLGLRFCSISSMLLLLSGASTPFLLCSLTASSVSFLESLIQAVLELQLVTYQACRVMTDSENRTSDPIISFFFSEPCSWSPHCWCLMNLPITWISMRSSGLISKSPAKHPRKSVALGLSLFRVMGHSYRADKYLGKIPEEHSKGVCLGHM